MRAGGARLLCCLGLTAVVASACSATAGHGASLTSHAAVLPSSRPAPQSSSSAPPAESLATLLHTADASLRTAHVVVAISQGGPGALQGVADERLSRGTISAMRLTQDLGAGITYDVIVVGARAYAQLPSFYPTSKPWVLVSATSTLAPVRSIANGLVMVRATGSPATLEQYVAAATSVRRIGTRKVDGRPTTGYMVAVASGRLPTSNPLRAKLLAAGVTSLPVEIDVDDAGHGVRFISILKSGGGASEIIVTWSRFDRPVSVTAPPAGEVGTS